MISEPRLTRVLVIGAYGLIGAHVCSALHEAGFAVLRAGRSLGQARRRLPHVRWLAIDLARATTQDWLEPLAGVEAVVN